MLDSLRQSTLLDGLRDRPAVDVVALCLAAERFSILAAQLGDVIDEIDINPIIVHPAGCIAVDAIVVCSRKGPRNGILDEAPTIN